MKRSLYILAFCVSVAFVSIAFGTERALTQSVSAGHIQKTVVRFLTEDLSYSPQDFMVEVGRIPKRLSELHSQSIRLQARPAHLDREIRGRTVFFVNVFVGGSLYAKVPIVVNVRLFGEVLVARHVLDRHILISEDDIACEHREITKLQSVAARESSEVLGMRTRRVIPAGQILCLDDIREPPCVAKGDILTVDLQIKSLTLSLKAWALQDGWIGDRIDVRALNGREKYVAEVREAGSAVIKL